MANFMQKSRGSAILIAVFLIAAVGSVAFGIGRLFMMESTIANVYESSTVAYYAAESGIEEGYLRYRYDKNTVVPNSTTTIMSRNGLDDMIQANFSQINYDNFNPVANLRYYFLTMGYKQKYYGVDLNGDTTLDINEVADPDYENHKEAVIPYDESIKIDVTDITPNVSVGGITGGDAQFLFKVMLPTATYCQPGYDARNSFIEAKVTGISGGKLIEQKVALTPYISTLSGVSYLKFNNSGVGTISSKSGILGAIRSTTTAANFDSNNDHIELYLKPVGCSIAFGIIPASYSAMIAGPYSMVKSIGMYGGITRTLEAKIDRQAGTVYDLFDYVLYKKP